MTSVVFRYRSRELTPTDIEFINQIILRYYDKGRTFISRVLCRHWDWRQPNGRYKEYAARDLLLRLEERGFIELPPRQKENNNKKKRAFVQIPLFVKHPLEGLIGAYPKPIIYDPFSTDRYLWDYLVYHYHYLGLPTLVGESLKYLVYLEGQVIACLGWSSAAFKVGDRDSYIGWDAATRKRRLHLVVNNCRFLILPWIQIKHLASKVLALNLKRLNADWQNKYGHPIYLAESFVDTSRFRGTCYQASNWRYAGQTKGSGKRGNVYYSHGRPKAVYLYPLHRNFRRWLTDDTG